MPSLIAKGDNTIMASGSTIVKQRQLAIRRQLDQRGIALKVIAMDSGLSYSTLASYFPADKDADPAQMPTGVLYDLCGHIPDDLLSLMLPVGRQIVRLPDDLDHDALSDLAADYLSTKAAAHKADSPAGVAISDCERDVLDRKVVALRAA